MSKPRTKRQEDARLRVLRAVSENPGISQRELAKVCGISLGSAHYALQGVVERGLVKLENFSNAKSKRGYAYVLTPQGVSEKAAITRRFLARRLEEYEALKAEIDGLAAEVGVSGQAESLEVGQDPQIEP